PKIFKSNSSLSLSLSTTLYSSDLTSAPAHPHFCRSLPLLTVSSFLSSYLQPPTCGVKEKRLDEFLKIQKGLRLIFLSATAFIQSTSFPG
ncbi:hypothetical protein G4B88_008703, partial [Cannabis sativa]